MVSRFGHLTQECAYVALEGLDVSIVPWYLGTDVPIEASGQAGEGRKLPWQKRSNR
jgi:hypothetical protein